MTTREIGGLDLPRETLAKLEVFETLARRWTERINLVAASTVADLWTRHIVDSAQLWPLAPAGSRTWTDLGSGGGFPGIVIAILADDVARVTLIESDQRKCAFLRTAARELDLAVTILDQRAESAPPQDAPVVSARALAPLAALLPLVARHLALGGTALLPKGRDHATEIAAARAAGWSFRAEALPSVTDPNARVLRLVDMSHG